MATFFNQNATLNQFDAVFKEIASNHGMLNAYGEGELSEIDTKTVESYPLLWNRIEPVKIHENYTEFNFRIFVMDLVHPDNSNLLDVQSDSLATIHDIIYLLRDYYSLDITYDISATPFVDAFPDKVAGWYVVINVNVGWSIGSCDVPFKSAISGSTNYAGPFPGSGCGYSIKVQDTSTIKLIGDGSSCDPVQGIIQISSGSGNIIQINTDGLFASGSGGSIETGSFLTTSSFNTFSSSYNLDSSSFNNRILSGSGAITSIISDGSLTVTTGSSVTASINLAHANTWTGIQGFSADININSSHKANFLSSGSGNGISLYNSGATSGYAGLNFYPSVGTNIACNLAIIPKGSGQSNNKAGLSIFATDFVANSTNAEYWTMTATGAAYRFSSQALGIGSFRAQIFDADNSANQLILNTTGNILIGTGTDNGVDKLQVNGSVKATQYKISALNTAPVSSTDTGTLGEIRVTSTYIYVCTATNTWVRTALTTF